MGVRSPARVDRSPPKDYYYSSAAANNNHSHHAHDHRVSPRGGGGASPLPHPLDDRVVGRYLSGGTEAVEWPSRVGGGGGSTSPRRNASGIGHNNVSSSGGGGELLVLQSGRSGTPEVFFNDSPRRRAGLIRGHRSIAAAPKPQWNGSTLAASPLAVLDYATMEGVTKGLATTRAVALEAGGNSHGYGGGTSFANVSAASAFNNYKSTANNNGASARKSSRMGAPPLFSVFRNTEGNLGTVDSSVTLSQKAAAEAFPLALRSSATRRPTASPQRRVATNSPRSQQAAGDSSRRGSIGSSASVGLAGANGVPQSRSASAAGGGLNGYGRGSVSPRRATALEAMAAEASARAAAVAPTPWQALHKSRTAAAAARRKDEEANRPDVDPYGSDIANASIRPVSKKTPSSSFSAGHALRREQMAARRAATMAAVSGSAFAAAEASRKGARANVSQWLTSQGDVADSNRDPAGGSSDEEPEPDEGQQLQSQPTAISASPERTRGATGASVSTAGGAADTPQAYRHGSSSPHRPASYEGARGNSQRPNVTGMMHHHSSYGGADAVEEEVGDLEFPEGAEMEEGFTEEDEDKEGSDDACEENDDSGDEGSNGSLTADERIAVERLSLMIESVSAVNASLAAETAMFYDALQRRREADVSRGPSAGRLSAEGDSWMANHHSHHH